MHFGSGLMMGVTWVACFLVMTSIGQSAQVHDLNCSEVCDSITHRRRIKDWFSKAVCDCSSENADLFFSKQLDDSGIYFEPAEDVYSMQQLAIRPFYILNPTTSLNIKSPKKLTKRKLTHNNKHEKRTASLSLAEPPETSKQYLYLDVGIENPVETSLYSTEQKLSIRDPFTLSEKDFAECVELYTLVYSEMDNIAHLPITNVLKRSGRHSLQSEQIANIKEKCSQPADIVRRSLQQIKRTWAHPKASSVKGKKSHITKDKTNLRPKLSSSTNVEEQLLNSKTDFPNVSINYEGEINNPLNEVTTISINGDVIRDEQIYNESNQSEKFPLMSENIVSNNVVSDVRLGSLENFQIDYTTEENKYFTSIPQYNNTLDYEDNSNKNNEIENNVTEHGTEVFIEFDESNQNITNNNTTDRVAFTEIYKYSDETTSLEENLKSRVQQNTEIDVFRSNNQSTSDNLTVALESVNDIIEEKYSTETDHQLKKTLPTNISSQNQTNSQYPNTKISNKNYDSDKGFAIPESVENKSQLSQDKIKTLTQIKYLTQTGRETTISSLDEQNSLEPDDDTYKMSTGIPSALLVSFSEINDINNKSTRSVNDKGQPPQDESTTAADSDYFNDKIIQSVQNSSEFSNTISGQEIQQHQTAYDMTTNAVELTKDTLNKTLSSRDTAPETVLDKVFVFKSDVTDTKFNNQPTVSLQIANGSLPNDNILGVEQKLTIINSSPGGNITKPERVDAMILDQKEGLRSQSNKSDIDQENTTQAIDFANGETDDRSRNNSEIQFSRTWTTDKQSTANIPLTENVEEPKIDNNIPKKNHNDFLMDYLNEINISSAIDLKEKLNSSDVWLSEGSSTEFARNETVKGNLVLIFNNSNVPAKFIQKDNGEISIGIDGEALCSKLINAENSQSLLIKVMCNCILYKKCTNSRT